LPLRDIGIPDPILAMLDAPLRVIIEQGYDRNLSSGVPTPAQFFRIPNLIGDAVNLLSAIPVGIDDGTSDAITPGNYNTFRPLGTTHAGMYGVGGRTPNAPVAMTPAAAAPSTPVPTPQLAASVTATRPVKPVKPVESIQSAAPAKAAPVATAHARKPATARTAKHAAN
jgi:PE-PPE domain